MNDKPKKLSIREAVLEHIRHGDVSMRPRWFFVLRGALIGVGIVVVAFTLLFVASLTVFALRTSGVWFVPAFGWRGWGTFVWSLPFVLIALTIIFIVILEMMVQHYAIVYREPLLYSALGVLALASIGGFLVAETPFHAQLLDRAEHNGLPIVGPFYQQFGDPRIGNVHAGIVTILHTDGFGMKTRRGEDYSVVVNGNTVYVSGGDVQPNDFVVVFGEENNDTIQALGVRRINEMMHNDILRQQTSTFFNATP